MEAKYHVTFNFSIKWILSPYSKSDGKYHIILPDCFGSSKVHQYIQLNSKASYVTHSVQMGVDSSIVDQILKLPFSCKIEIPDLTSNQKNAYMDSMYQIDLLQLLSPDKQFLSFSCAPKGFSKLIFGVSIDQPLISKEYIEEFAPLFLIVNSVTFIGGSNNAFCEKNDIYAPVQFECNVGNNCFYICPLKHQSNYELDIVIPILSRSQTNVKFEMFNKRKDTQSTHAFYGSGFLPVLRNKVSNPIHDSENEIKESPFLECEFELLPPRSDSIYLSSKDHSHTSVQFHFEIYDPSVDKISLLASQNIKSSLQVLLNEDESDASEFYRFIFSLTNSNVNKNITTDLNNILAEQEALLGDIRCDRAIKITHDVITGFSFHTPKENLYVLEARAMPKSDVTLKILDVINRYPNISYCNYDTTKTYDKRYFTNESCLVKRLRCPITMEELKVLETFHFRNDKSFELNSIFNKLCNLFSLDLTDFEKLPSTDEINLLVEKRIISKNILSSKNKIAKSLKNPIKFKKLAYTILLESPDDSNIDMKDILKLKSYTPKKIFNSQQYILIPDQELTATISFFPKAKTPKKKYTSYSISEY